MFKITSCKSIILDHRVLFTIMEKVHSGICGSYLAGTKMIHVIPRRGYYLPKIMDDCNAYTKRCSPGRGDKIYQTLYCGKVWNSKAHHCR